jgi:hypothetical protein
MTTNPFQVAETWDRLTYVERNFQRSLLHRTLTFIPRSQEIAAPTYF